MKKRLFCMCMAALVLATAGCGNRKDGNESLTEQTQETQESESLSAQPSQDAAEEISGGETGEWSEEMAGVRTAVIDELGDDYWPEMAMSPEILEMNFGLTSDMYVDFMGEMPMMSTKVDTLLIVKAAEGRADEVEQALQDYRTAKIEDTMQYPMNIGKVQACRVERMDDYVCFLLLGGDISEVEDAGDEALIAHSQEHNQRAVDAIKKQLNK